MKNRPSWTESQESRAFSAAASLCPIFLVSGAWRVLRKHLLYDSSCKTGVALGSKDGLELRSLGCVPLLRSAT